MAVDCRTNKDYRRTMKELIYDESEDSGAGAGGAVRQAAGGGAGKGEAQRVGEGVSAGRLEKPPVKPAGTSITLWGCGRRDGKDVNNSMGLVEAYRFILGL